MKVMRKAMGDKNYDLEKEVMRRYENGLKVGEKGESKFNESQNDWRMKNKGKENLCIIEHKKAGIKRYENSKH